MRLCTAALLLLPFAGCLPDPNVQVPDFALGDGGGTDGGAGGADAGDGGAGWVAASSGTMTSLRGVWVADARLSVVYVVGQQGTILRGAGTSFAAEQSPTTVDLYAVLGLSADEAIAAGSNGTLLHRLNGKWMVEAQAPRTTADLFGLAMPQSGEIFAVGDRGTVLHRTGGAWKTEPGPDTTDLRAVWGKDLTEVYAVGAGSVWRRTNNAWTTDAALQAANKANFFAVTGLDGTPFLAGEYGTVMQRDPAQSRWIAEPTIKPAAMMGPPAHFYGLFGQTGELLVVGQGGQVQHRAVAMGAPAWTMETSGTQSDLYAVAGGGLHAVVAVGAAGAVVRRP